MTNQNHSKRYSDLQAQCDAIDILVDHTVYSEEKETYPVFDGIINVDKYVDEPLKIYGF